MFALGFAHAQDRLWQMELQRRVGAGRMSELVGADALPIDKFMRTLGLYRLAEQSIDHLSPETKRGFDAYSAGVNAYINAPSRRVAARIRCCCGRGPNRGNRPTVWSGAG